MADPKYGPVKPPILDLEAGPAKDKKTGDDKSASDTKKDRKGSSVPSWPAWASPKNWQLAFDSRLMTGIAAGALLGAGLAFGLALSGLWPEQATPPTADTDLAVAALERRLDTIEQRAGEEPAITADIDERISALEATTTDLSETGENLSALRAEVAALADREPVQPEVDLSPLERQLTALSSRVDALASGASSEDATAIADEISGLRTEIESINQSFDGFQTEMTRFEDTVTALGADVTALDTAVAGLKNDMQAAPEAPDTGSETARLPLALSGIEGALSSGRSFDAELALLQRALPGLAISDPVAAAAVTGLPAPGSVTRNLNAVIPDILAATPLDPDAGWQAALTGRLQSLLALRPAGDTDDTSPRALVARLENAVAARDFSGAAMLFSSLPEPMRTAAGAVGADIALLAEAEALVASARKLALEPLETQDL